MLSQGSLSRCKLCPTNNDCVLRCVGFKRVEERKMTQEQLGRDTLLGILILVQSLLFTVLQCAAVLKLFSILPVLGYNRYKNYKRALIAVQS